MRIVAKEALLPDGWARNVAVEVEGGRITSVGTGDQPTVDLLLPAPVNLHSHAFQRDLRGVVAGCKWRRCRGQPHAAPPKSARQSEGCP